MGQDTHTERLASRLRRLALTLDRFALRSMPSPYECVDARGLALIKLVGQTSKPYTVQEAARQLGVSHASIAQTSKKLQMQGYLFAMRDPHDARARRLVLSPLGDQCLAAVLAADADLQRLISHYSPHLGREIQLFEDAVIRLGEPQDDQRPAAENIQRGQ